MVSTVWHGLRMGELWHQETMMEFSSGTYGRASCSKDILMLFSAWRGHQTDKYLPLEVVTVFGFGIDRLENYA